LFFPVQGMLKAICRQVVQMVSQACAPSGYSTQFTHLAGIPARTLWYFFWEARMADEPIRVIDENGEEIVVEPIQPTKTMDQETIEILLADKIATGG
jgi:hypothetical protein